MKFIITYENKTLSLPLTSPIRVKDLLHELSKKLNISNEQKISLFNPTSNTCYDDQDFISNTEDLEALLFKIDNFKLASDKKKSEKLEELISTCTNAKEPIKINLKNKYFYPKYGGYERSSYKNYNIDKFERKAYLNSFIPTTTVRTDNNKEGSNNTNLQKSNADNSEEVSGEKLKELKESHLSLENRLKSIVESMDSTNKEKAEKVELIQKEMEILKEVALNKNVIEPPKIQPDTEKLETLLAMGYDENKCKKALIVSQNNLEHAANLLLEGSDFELYDQMHNPKSSNANFYYENKIENNEGLRSKLEKEMEKKGERISNTNLFNILETEIEKLKNEKKKSSEKDKDTDKDKDKEKALSDIKDTLALEMVNSSNPNPEYINNNLRIAKLNEAFYDDSAYNLEYKSQDYDFDDDVLLNDDFQDQENSNYK